MAAEYLNKGLCKGLEMVKVQGSPWCPPQCTLLDLMFMAKVLGVFDMETSSQSYAQDNSVKPRTRTLNTVTVFQISNKNFIFFKKKTPDFYLYML